VEQLANLLYRKAEKVDDEEAHKALFDKASKHVQWTLELHPTVERLCLMGSLYKREAVWRVKKGLTGQRDTNLQEALRWYEWACNPEKVENPEFDAYPDLNAAALELLLGQADEKWIERVKRIAALSEARAQDGSVWDRTGLVDAALLLEIQAKTLGQTAVQDELISRYLSAFQSATRRQRDSVVSQLEVMRDLLDERLYAGEFAGLTRLIEALAIKNQ
jgi:tetratricopeptide repeat protein